MLYSLAEEAKKSLLRFHMEDVMMDQEFTLPDGQKFELDESTMNLARFMFSSEKQGVRIWS